MRRSLAVLAGLAAVPGFARAAAADASLLLFSKTAGYRHASIPTAVAALQDQAAARDWTILATEDAAVFTDGTLANIDAAVFLMNTGDVLDEAQQAGLQAFVEGGHGFVGIHATVNAETRWPWFGTLIGTRFVDHPAPQDAIVHVVAPRHPACAGLPQSWSRFDEWYNFTASPSDKVDVLLQLDESTYQGGTMGRDHPIAWTHELAGARVFYTAGGHPSEAWADPQWLAHVTGGIAWVVEADAAGGASSSEGGGDSGSGERGETESGSTSAAVTASSDGGASSDSGAPGGSSSASAGAAAAPAAAPACACSSTLASRRGEAVLALLIALFRRRPRRAETPPRRG
ncbi:MAG: ThuA domain-containing protein [Nannocystaceae bacterium]